MRIGAVAFVLLIALLLLSPLSPTTHVWASGSGLILGGVACALACHHQTRRAGGTRRKRAWAFAALAVIFGTLGNAWLLVAGGSMGPRAGVSPSDVCLVIALLFGVAAVITFPSTPRRPAEVTRILLDGVVIGGSLLYFASVTVFPQIVGPAGDLGSRALPLLVPVFDIVAATAAFLLYLRRNPADGHFLGLLSVGFVFFSVSDFASAVLTVDTPFSLGSAVDLGWIAGYVTFAVAVYEAPAVSRPPLERRPESALASTGLMFTLFFLAAAAGVWQQGGALSAVSVTLWMLVLVGLIGRQVSLIIDNEKMRQVLEQKVIKGSRDLRAMTQRTDLLVNSVGDGIYGVDREGTVTFVNPVAARTLGYAPAELIGVNAHATFHAPQASGQPFPEGDCYVQEAITHGLVTNAEEDRYVRADGGVIPVEVTASPTTNDGEPIGAVVVFRDVTQRQEIDRLKNEFVSVVSHELRTPLTSIRGSLGLVASGRLGELTPTANRMVTIALDSSVRLNRLINDILDVERIHSGVMPMNIGEHAVQDLVENAVTQVNVLADRASVRIELGPLDGRVIADGGRVEQTLINLLDNAIKFSPRHGRIRVHTEAVSSFVEFVIRDEGRGIPPDKLDVIFRRFQQVDSSDAREKGGTGLGLAISRSIVERLGGRIWAENNEDRGATMRFTLPRAELATGPSIDASSEDRLTTSTY